MAKRTLQRDPVSRGELMADLWSDDIRLNPYNFVMYSFPWGQPGTDLENYQGPRKWQREILLSIAEHARANETSQDPSMYRHAVAAGRGIGKSALISWLVLWGLVTRIGSTTIVSANSEHQLKSVTWAEVKKWLAMAEFADWFDETATKIFPHKWLAEKVESELKISRGYWYADSRLWSIDNPDAFAGVHNHRGVNVIFDEASGIPDSIWAVSQGFFTEKSPFRYWFAMSNPRRSTGAFFDLFNGDAARLWQTTQIDARSVEGTDPKVYEDIIEQYGKLSAQAQVEVYGEFPLSTDESYIPRKLVEDAQERERWPDTDQPIILGVDPAGRGPDTSSIAVRQGRNLLAVHRYGNLDIVQLSDKVSELIDTYQAFMTIVDATGMGVGVYDILNKLYTVRAVHFGAGANNPRMYFNRRAELWGELKQWLRYAALPKDRKILTSITNIRQIDDEGGKIKLEPKKVMITRVGDSPDDADAIALTLAVPLSHNAIKQKQKQRRAQMPAAFLAGPTATKWMA